jgi:hypothetical protein
MAIPITCPGCQAAFEVPETLGGKTIRCTSCKTQLTVPVADAKKPFGSASLSTKATSAPLSLDDDGPATGRVAKPGSAAAKSIPAKAAVAVGEEDDPKTNPSKSSSKNGPAIKGAPRAAKRRDDDDDDDDDDRPTRRKSKGAAAGGGAMIALIGGGVLCLAAIVGLSVWLLSDNKEETAKSDNSNNSSPAPTAPTGNTGGPGETGGGLGGTGGTGGADENSGGAIVPPTPQDGAMGMKPGRRPPRPGGGGNIGTGDNPFASLGGRTELGTMGDWATFRGDGFTAEFPGTPETISQSVAGGGQNVPVKLYALGKSNAAGYIVLSMQFPASLDQIPGGSQTVLNAMFNAMKVRNPRDVTVDGLTGREGEYSDPTGSGTVRVFAVKDRLFLMGSIGKASDQAAATRFLGSVKITYRGDSNTVAGGGPVGGGMSPGGFPQPGGIGAPTPGGLPRPPVGGTGGFPQPPGGGIGIPQPGGGIGTPTPGGGVGAPVGDELPQPPGTGFGTPQPPAGGGGLGAPTPGGGGIGGPGGVRPGGFPQPPGGGIGGGRPQPGGGFPQPGGGFGGGQSDSNPPPTGAITEGNRKANVEPFFSAAFDSQKKEFYSFSARASGNFISTRLNRFDVSRDFAPAGAFKVPSFVTRAVIDSSKGLLYVATVSRPTVAALGSQMLDQSVGVGDVQVFDLSAIRDGKIKDGGELKPVATIGFGREIRGLELSSDGMTLTVLSSTPGRSAKSFLVAYDTESRKPLGPPKELPEPAWDSCKSPDGKHLVVIDKVDPGKASRARMYDLMTLIMVKTVDLQGGALDVTATQSGGFAAAVVSNGNSKVVLANDKEVRDLDVGAGWKAAAKPGYVEFSPDGKLLFVSGHPGASGSYARQGQQQQPAGLDVYEVVDADAPTGFRKKASIRTAGGQMVGGHFLLSPGGEYLVFHTGAVVETANIGGNNGQVAPGGFGGGVGGGNFPGGVAPQGPGGAVPQPPGGPGGGVGAPVGDPLPGPPTPAVPGPGGMSPRPGGGAPSGQPMYPGSGGMSPRPGAGAPGGQPMYPGAGGMSPRPGGMSPAPGGGPAGGQPMYPGAGGMSPRPGGGN